MPQVPSKVAVRLSQAIKRFQPIIASAKSRDANESDTVIVVTDMFSEVFGYDKYSQITSECSIRRTWCDLAIKMDGVPRSPQTLGWADVEANHKTTCRNINTDIHDRSRDYQPDDGRNHG
jgi:hypothetical protein